jgi:GNAT superfamily N-acetyltransferase
MHQRGGNHRSAIVERDDGGVLIRGRRQADLRECVSLLEAVHLANRYPTRWPDDPRAWLSPSRLLAALVVTEGNEIVGHVAVTDLEPAERRRMELSRLFVSPEQRRHGVGATLVDKVVDYARQHKSDLALVVVDDRSGTLTFYERQGWRLTGRSPAGWRLLDGSRPNLAHFEYPFR